MSDEGSVPVELNAVQVEEFQVVEATVEEHRLWFLRGLLQARGAVFKINEKDRRVSLISWPGLEGHVGELSGKAASINLMLKWYNSVKDWNNDESLAIGAFIAAEQKIKLDWGDEQLFGMFVVPCVLADPLGKTAWSINGISAEQIEPLLYKLCRVQFSDAESVLKSVIKRPVDPRVHFLVPVVLPVMSAEEIMLDFEKSMQPGSSVVADGGAGMRQLLEGRGGNVDMAPVRGRGATAGSEYLEAVVDPPLNAQYRALMQQMADLKKEISTRGSKARSLKLPDLKVFFMYDRQGNLSKPEFADWLHLFQDRMSLLDITDDEVKLMNLKSLLSPELQMKWQGTVSQNVRVGISLGYADIVKFVYGQGDQELQIVQAYAAIEGMFQEPGHSTDQHKAKFMAALGRLGQVTGNAPAHELSEGYKIHKWSQTCITGQTPMFCDDKKTPWTSFMQLCDYSIAHSAIKVLPRKAQGASTGGADGWHEVPAAKKPRVSKVWTPPQGGVPKSHAKPKVNAMQYKGSNTKWPHPSYGEGPPPPPPGPSPRRGAGGQKGTSYAGGQQRGSAPTGLDCFYCHGPGHYAKHCQARKEDEGNNIFQRHR
jgi:hypothetical protein